MEAANEKRHKQKRRRRGYFVSLFEPNAASLSPETAKGLLAIGFREQDKARMHDLAIRNQDGTLSEDERQSLLSSIEAGHILGLLHAKARRVLKTREGS